MKLASTALLAAIVTFTARGDAEAQLFGEMDFGGKAGLNIATYVGPDGDGEVEKSVDKLAFSVGGVGSFAIHRMLAVQVELLFSTKGTKIVSPVGGDREAHFYYIDIPLLAKLEFPLGLQVTPYLLAGPGVGVLLHAVGENADGSRVDITRNTSTLDVGPIIGIGGSYSMGSRGALQFEARYFRGLTTLSASGESDYYNRTFTFMLGYQCCASSRQPRPD